MHDKNTSELQLSEQIEEMSKEALQRATKYRVGEVPSVAFSCSVGRKVALDSLETSLRDLGSKNVNSKDAVTFRLEGYGSGSSQTAINILAEETFPKAVENGSIRVPMIETKGSEPDVVIVTPLEGVEANKDAYRVFAGMGHGYAAISDNILVSAKKSLTQDDQSTNAKKLFRSADAEFNLGVWLVNLFKDPVSLKAYLSHSLGAAVFRNWNRECVSKEVYVADFQKTKCRVIGKQGIYLAGTDGMNICSGPDAKVEQIRYVTFWGVSVVGDLIDENCFAKGLLAPTHLSKIEGNTLVFDKDESKKLERNLVVLDIANFKNDSKSVFKDLLNKHGGIIRIDPRAPADTIADLLWAVTKISADEESSTTYQHVNNMFVSDPTILNELLKNYQPPRFKNDRSKIEYKVAAALSTVFDVPNLSSDLLAGNRSAKRILSDIAAYLPSIKMRKCIMSSILSKGQAVALCRSEKGDITSLSEFAFMRNPCLLPNSLKVLEGVRNDLIENIFNLDDFANELVIISPADASDAQADDDGDSVGCDPNPALIALIKEHQAFVKNSILRYAPKIELDKSARISYKGTSCVGETVRRIIDEPSYIELVVLQPEQPLVGWGSDMAVNFIRCVQWKWCTDPGDIHPELAQMENIKTVICETFGPGGSQGLWVPAEKKDVDVYCAWLSLVFITQTAIDWKKRMYRLMSLIILCIRYQLDQAGKYTPIKQKWEVHGRYDFSLDLNSSLSDQFLEKASPGERYRMDNEISAPGILGSTILAQYLMSGNSWSYESFAKLFCSEFVKNTWSNLGLWSISSLGMVGTTLARGVDLDWKRYAKSGLKVDENVSREDIINAFQRMHDTCSSNGIVKHLLAKSLAGNFVRPSVLSEYIANYNSVHRLIARWENVMATDSEFKSENAQILLTMTKVNLGIRRSMDLTSRRVSTWLDKAGIDLSKSENFKYFILLAGQGGIDNLTIRHLITHLTRSLDEVEARKYRIENETMNALDCWIWFIWRYTFKKMTEKTLGEVSGVEIKVPTVDNLLLMKKKDDNGHSPLFKVVSEISKFTSNRDNSAEPKTIFIRLVTACLVGSLPQKKLKFENKLSFEKDLTEVPGLGLKFHLKKVVEEINSLEDSKERELLKEVVVSNIARTIRSVNSLALLAHKDDRTKDMWHDDGSSYQDQRKIERQTMMFSSNDSLPTAIEKLILSKGYVPSQVLFQKKIVRSFYAWINKFHPGLGGDVVKGDKPNTDERKVFVISKSIANSGDRKIPYIDFIRYSLGVRACWVNDGNGNVIPGSDHAPFLPYNFLDQESFKKKYRS